MSCCSAAPRSPGHGRQRLLSSVIPVVSPSEISAPASFPGRNPNSDHSNTLRVILIEIYVFSNDQRWGPYEAIQADIFDHIFSALPEFDLRPFQNPTGSEIVAAAATLREGAQPG